MPYGNRIPTYQSRYNPSRIESGTNPYTPSGPVNYDIGEVTTVIKELASRAKSAAPKQVHVGDAIFTTLYNDLKYFSTANDQVKMIFVKEFAPLLPWIAWDPKTYEIDLNDYLLPLLKGKNAEQYQRALEVVKYVESGELEKELGLK